VGHNEKKNDPHFDNFVRHLSKLMGGPISRKEALDDEAREIARSWKESRLEEDLRWFRKKENRQDSAKTLRKAHRILKRIAPLLFDQPENPTIQVKEFKDRRLQEDTYDAAIKFIDYVSSGQLNRIADCLETFESLAGAAPKYTIKMAADDLAKFYRGNGGKLKDDGSYGLPRLNQETLETIAKIILEVFPEAQKRKGAQHSEGDRAGWIKQLVKRK
jgi:hypothetical protein